MKKIKLLIVVLILNSTFLILNCSAQYTKLRDFPDSLGGLWPSGTLISDGTFLYGAAYGGTNFAGVLYKIKPDGTAYSKIYNFNGTTDGNDPKCALIYDGTYLFGTTKQGGVNNMGVIFRIKPDGTGFTKLLDFAGANGSKPHGALLSDGTFLYGLTFEGGTNNLGVVYKIKPDGSAYAKLMDFSGGVSQDDQTESLISDGTFLYGVSWSSNSLFKIKPDGTGYSNIHTFSGPPSGGSPSGSFIFDGTFLYGTTIYGGGNLGGVIYKIKPDGTSYSDLFYFPGGSYPQGSLISDGTYLYGVTSQGGTVGMGTLYKIKPNGTGYLKLLDFNAINGSHPTGSLFSDGVSLYGVTRDGGTYGNGSIYKYYNLSISAIMNGVPICLNQCNGSATVTVSSGTPPYTISWNTTPAQTTATATDLCPGTAIVTVTDANSSASTTVLIDSLPPPLPPSICMVTVDDSSTHNVVIWEKTISSNISGYKIYREDVTNIYTHIGTVPYDSLSEYHDYGADPNITTKRYKLSTLDTCGVESALSPFHNTIYITASGTGQYNWNLYTIEGAGNPVNNYVLYRDNASTGSWNIVSFTAGTQQTLNDPNYSSYPNGSWRVETLWNITCTPTRVSVNTTRSNIKHSSTTTGINAEQKLGAIKMYPNPASENVSIELSESIQQATIKIMNSIGQLVFEQEVTSTGNSKTIKQINTSTFTKGIYTVVIESNKVKTYKQLVIN